MTRRHRLAPPPATAGCARQRRRQRWRQGSRQRPRARTRIAGRDYARAAGWCYGITKPFGWSGVEVLAFAFMLGVESASIPRKGFSSTRSAVYSQMMILARADIGSHFA